MSAERFTIELPPSAADIHNCTRKSRYPTKQIAKEAARRSSRRGVKISFYECPTCGRFHLSSVPQEVERARRREP